MLLTWVLWSRTSTVLLLAGGPFHLLMISERTLLTVMFKIFICASSPVAGCMMAKMIETVLATRL